MGQRRTRMVSVVLALACLLWVATPAWGHVSINPAHAAAGSRAKLVFRVGHGCAGSPTVKVVVKLPAGATAPEAHAPAGWNGSVAGDLVTFSGGKLDAKAKGDFALTVTLPGSKGTVWFPTVQTCERGTERWIQIPAPGQNPDDLDHPAPGVRLT